MVVMVINFDDFKSLAGDRRVYYYEGFDYYDFQFLVEGNIVKSTKLKDEIENKERFFSDKLFNGAIGLEFRIPADAENQFEFKVQPKIIVPPIDIYRDEEVKDDNKDIQIDGVEGDGSDTRQE